MPATMIMHTSEIALSLDDSLQVQCLPVYKTDRPKWTYRKVPKLTRFRNFERLPSWSRKPQGMTYQFCTEDMTKTIIVPSLLAEERDDLLNHGILPQESSARDRYCVMCPVRRGSPKLLPCCLRYNWCHPGCSYQTPWKGMSLSCADVRSKTEDHSVEASLSRGLCRPTYEIQYPG